MTISTTPSIRIAIVLLLATLFVVGCSSSGDSPSSTDVDEPNTEELGNNSVQLPSIPIQTRLQLARDKTFSISWQPSTDTQFYRVLENPDGLSGFTQISGNLDSSVQLFDYRVALYNRVNAKYIVQACNENGCVDSNELHVTGALDDAIGYIKASNAESEDSFGEVISLSGDGSTLVVAAPFEDSGAIGINGDQNDNSAVDSGAVYVFVRDNGTWQQQAYIKAGNNGTGDAFGWALALSADGDTLAVGVPNENSDATGINGIYTGNVEPRPDCGSWFRASTGSGAAYVFTRTGTTWQQQAYLKANTTSGCDAFAEALSLSADGNTLAVGAPGNRDLPLGTPGAPFTTGAAYVFERNDSTWQQQSKLVGVLGDTPVSSSQRMGLSISLSADGSILAATGDTSVVLFERDNGAWLQQQRLEFGFNVLANSNLSLSADGDTLAIGATGSLVNSIGIGVEVDLFLPNIRESGTAHVFERTNGIWQYQAFLKASNAEADDKFGTTVSLTADGNTLAVGAAGEDSFGMGFSGDPSDNSRLESGAVYLFKRSNNSWEEHSFIKAINSWGDKRFAQVSLSANGETLAVGAGGDSSSSTGINGEHFNGSTVSSGAVHLY